MSLALVGMLISEFRFSLDDEYRLVNVPVMFCKASFSPVQGVQVTVECH